MNSPHARMDAIASWTAAVLCRFGNSTRHGKAPEDWRTPKPGGTVVGSRKGQVHAFRRLQVESGWIAQWPLIIDPVTGPEWRRMDSYIDSILPAKGIAIKSANAPS